MHLIYGCRLTDCIVDFFFFFYELRKDVLHPLEILKSS